MSNKLKQFQLIIPTPRDLQNIAQGDEDPAIREIINDELTIYHKRLFSGKESNKFSASLRIMQFSIALAKKMN
jgi:hypothetical protein